MFNFNVAFYEGNVGKVFQTKMENLLKLIQQIKTSRLGLFR